MPAIAEKPFRDYWQEIVLKIDKPRYTVGLFSGCVQDFVYPEQILANKLSDVEQTGAELLLTDCPGCVMQLRGGLKKKESSVHLTHDMTLVTQRSA